MMAIIASIAKYFLFPTIISPLLKMVYP